MPFVLRPYRRFPICLPATYEAGFQEGQGTVWNLSPGGWRLSGNLSLQRGDVCSLKVRLASRKRVSVSAAIVRWVRGDEYGIETLVMSDESQERLKAYLHKRIKAL
jgi:hypothetical protein